MLEWRDRVRLYKSLVGQRTEWCQRIHAELFQHGVSVPEGAIRSAAVRGRIADEDVQLSPAARQRIRVDDQMIDATDTEALPLKGALTRFAMRQPACRALVDAQYGIGGLLAVAVAVAVAVWCGVVWCELGDCQRFSRSRQAVRHTGLDVTVDASNRRRADGYLARQGPETLRSACTKPRRTRPVNAVPTTPTTRDSRTVTAARSPRSPSPVSSREAAITSCATSIPRWCTPCRPDPDRERRRRPPLCSSESSAISS